MMLDPSDSKLIITSQKKTIKKLRDGIAEIKRQTETSLEYSDKNRYKRNHCVESVSKECVSLLDFLDNRSASLKLKLEGTDRGQMKLGDGVEGR